MKVLDKILSSVLALFLAARLIRGVEVMVIPGKSSYFGFDFTKNWQMIIFLGVILGLANVILRPLLNFFSLPLRILTFGLFSLFLNCLFLFSLDIIFPELKIEGFLPLLFTTLLILFLEFLLK